MKIVFKTKEAVKMYNGAITYADICVFIQKEFPSFKQWSMSFEDEEGDAIMITADVDLEVMREMFPDKEFMKIDLMAGEIAEKKV